MKYIDGSVFKVQDHTMQKFAAFHNPLVAIPWHAQRSKGQDKITSTHWWWNIEHPEGTQHHILQFKVTLEQLH